MRRRIIRPNVRSFVGRHVCPASGEAIRVESALELDAVTLIRSRNPRAIVEQPETYRFTDSHGRQRKYTPDFRVTYGDGRILVYEVKFRQALRARWPEYREVLRFMRQRLVLENARFRFLTEATVRSTKVENLRLISPHLRMEPDSPFATRLLSIVSEAPISIGEAAKRLCITPTDRAAFYGALWPLLARGNLVTDLNQPIGMSTVLEVPNGR